MISARFEWSRSRSRLRWHGNLRVGIENFGERVDLLTALTANGYAPTETDSGDVELLNCPFRQLAGRPTSAACGLNRAV